MKILVSGGCGYIGSHVCIRLAEAGHEPVVVDNLCNSKEAVLSRIKAVCGVRPRFYRGDVRDAVFLGNVFSGEKFDAVIHFAGLKAVGESVRSPLDYYDNNVIGSLRLLEAMCKAGVRRFVFSSSATVYGDAAPVPYVESFPVSASNPYGWTKIMVERMLADLALSDPAWSVMILRYFNPIGAHPSGLMGEDPQGVPSNLMPFIAQVAVRRREKLSVFGGDYPTRDGTGVRDYIHVLDLADGHIAALDYASSHPGCHTFNLGTGRGASVLELLTAFSRACGRELPYEIVDRRPGDLAAYWADPAKAKKELGWSAGYTISDMAAHAWKWQTANPDGYPDE